MNGIAPRAHDTYHYPAANGSVTVGHAHDCWCLGGTEKALWEHTPTEASHVVEKEPWKPKVGQHVRCIPLNEPAEVVALSGSGPKIRFYASGATVWCGWSSIEPI